MLDNINNSDKRKNISEKDITSRRQRVIDILMFKISESQ